MALAASNDGVGGGGRRRKEKLTAGQQWGKAAWSSAMEIACAWREVAGTALRRLSTIVETRARVGGALQGRRRC